MSSGAFTSAGSRRPSNQHLLNPWFRATCERQPRSPLHDPPADLRRPPARDRGRAPRLPDALVARDVRPRTLEGVRDLSRRARWRRARRLLRLLALRHGLALDERGRQPGSTPRGCGRSAADAALRQGRQARGAVHARGAAVERRRNRPLRELRLQACRAAQGLLPRQQGRRPDHVADRGGGVGGPGDVILGIETSCDDTCAAVVSADGQVLSNVVASQGLLHAEYGGVVPEIASRRHLELVDAVLEDALEKAGTDLDGVGAVAVTNGPGLIGALLVGLSAAKGLAAARGLPLTPVDHLLGHVLASTLRDEPIEPPFLCLVASGGHTFLAHVDEPRSYRRLGSTLDDAAGEAFDKGARILGLGYPGGPLVQRAAEGGDPEAFDFPRSHPGEYDFSFSGLKTSLLYKVRDIGTERLPDLAASYQEAILDALSTRAPRAIASRRVERFAIGGGVAANKPLRERITAICDELGVALWI